MQQRIKFQGEVERSELPLLRKINFTEVVENEKLLDDYIWQEVFQKVHDGKYPSDVAKDDPHERILFNIFAGRHTEFPGTFFDDAKKRYFADKARYLATGEIPSD